MKEERAAAFKCNQDDCNKIFKGKGPLNAHINKVHVISTCRLCDDLVTVSQTDFVPAGLIGQIW